MLLQCSCKFEQFDSLPGCYCLVSIPGNSSTRSQVFQAAIVATSTASPMPVNGHMAQLSSGPVYTFHDLAINNHPAAYTCTDSQVHHVAARTPRAKQVLSQASRMRVILYKDLQLCSVASLTFRLKVVFKIFAQMYMFAPR